MTAHFVAPRSVDPNGIWGVAGKAERKRIVLDGIAAEKNPRQIADACGATKNAIIGFAHREEIRLREIPRKDRHKRVAARAAVASARLCGCGDAFVADLRSVAADAWLPLPGSPVRSFMANEGCRWPVVGDEVEGYCGCDMANGSPYCATHAARARAPQRATGGKK